MRAPRVLKRLADHLSPDAMRAPRFASVASAAVLVLALGAPAQAQGPATAGGEFRVNAAIAVASGSPAVASDAAGNHVVVWDSQGQDGDGLGVYGRLYSAAGVPVGAEFRVNTTTAGNQNRPDVAMNASGAFVVAWTNASDNGITVRTYSATGTPTTGEIRVSTAANYVQFNAAVAMAPTGAFVVSWTGYPGTVARITARMYSAAGQPVGSEITVNEATTSAYTSDVGVASDGSFVVVYEQLVAASRNQVYVRRYGAAGALLGAPVPVATATGFSHVAPVVAVGGGGAFVVAWQSDGGADGSGSGVYARRFTAAGVASGNDFRANVATAGNQAAPSVALDTSGNAVVVWQSDGQDGGGLGVYGRRYAADGTPVGGEFRVNTYTDGNQYLPSVTSSPAGDLTVMWESDGQDGFAAGIYGQRLNRPGVAGESGAAAAGLTLAVAPNPTSGAAVVRYETAAAQRVSVSVVDVLGRTVAVLVDGEQSAGPHEVPLDTSALAGGVYSVRFMAGGRVLTRRLTVAR